jgi:hypothetical protein
MLFFTFRLFTLFICAELILGSITPSMRLVQSAQAQEGCAQGMTYSQQLNRCVVSKEVNTQIDNKKDCMKMADGAARVECLKSAINTSALDDVKGKPKVSSTGAGWISTSMGMATFATVSAITSIIQFKVTQPTCKAMSMLLMGAGAAASMGGEVASIVKYNKKIKEARKKFDDLKTTASAAESDNLDAQNEIATNIQVGAFDAMIAKENATKESAKIKKAIYTASIAAYGLAAAMAAYELVQIKMARAKMQAAYTALISAIGSSTVCGSTAGALAAVLPAQTKWVTDFANIEALEGSNTIKAATFTAGGFFRRTMATVSNQSVAITAQTTSTALGITAEAQAKTPQALAGCVSGLGSAVTGAATNLGTAYADLLRVEQKNICELVPMIGENSTPKSPLNFIEYFENQKSIAEVKQYLDDYINSLSDKTLADYSRALIAPILGYAYADDGMEPVGKKFTTYIGPIVGAAGALVASFSVATNYLFGAPLGRIAFSGAMAAFGGVVLANAIKNQKYAEERAKVLEELKAKITNIDGIYTCKVADRSDTSKPQCYCYNPDGTKNSSKNNSQVCIAEWGNPVKFNISKNSLAGADKGPMGCVDNKNKFDEKCSCRATKDPKTGKNSCMKMSLNAQFPIPQMNKFGTQVGSALNSIHSGEFDSANISGLENQYGAIRKMKDAILKNLNDPKLVKVAQDAEDNLIKTLSSQNLNQAMPPFNTAPVDLSLSSNPKEMVAAIEKDLKKSADASQSLAAVQVPGLGNLGVKDDAFNLNMGDDASGGGVVEETTEVAAQEFDLGTNDISNNPGGNIFEVLSLRYKRSAMRRLFSGEDKIKADEANESEINP